MGDRLAGGFVSSTIVDCDAFLKGGMQILYIIPVSNSIGIFPLDERPELLPGGLPDVG
jgi:hypothetical protein